MALITKVDLSFFFPSFLLPSLPLLFSFLLPFSLLTILSFSFLFSFFSLFHPFLLPSILTLFNDAGEKNEGGGEGDGRG